MNFKNFFKLIMLSFYSPDLYMSVIDKWHHWGLKFLLRFSILVTLVASVTLFTLISMMDFNSNSIKTLLDNIPELNIHNDQASFVNPQIKSPIYIKADDSDKNIILLDLDTSDAEKYQNDSLIVFVSDKIVLNLIQSSPITVTYKDLIAGSDTNIVNEKFFINFFNEQQKKILGIILLVGVPLGSLIYFVLTILKVTFFSSIASLIAMVFKINLSFKQLTRVAIIANIPAVIVSSVFSIMLFRNAGSDADQLIVNSVHLFYFVGAIMIYLKRIREV